MQCHYKEKKFKHGGRGGFKRVNRAAGGSMNRDTKLARFKANYLARIEGSFGRDCILYKVIKSLQDSEFYEYYRPYYERGKTGANPINIKTIYSDNKVTYDVYEKYLAEWALILRKSLSDLIYEHGGASNQNDLNIILEIDSNQSNRKKEK